MELIYKDDWDEARRRMEAWWEGEVNQNLTFFLVFAILKSKKILLLRKKLWQEQLKL